MAPTISKVEMRRRRRALLDQRTNPTPLPPALATRLNDYRPRASEVEWAAIEPVFREVMLRSKVTSPRTFKDTLFHLALYMLDAHRAHRPTTAAALMTCTGIDTYAAALSCPSNQSRASIRSALRSLARRVNPGPDAPPKAPSIPYRAVRPPYSAEEVASIVRVAMTQPTETAGRQLSALVGLGLGAGLDSEDFRVLRCRDIDDRGDAGGILVTITSRTPRRVMVRRCYEELVRRGVARLREGDLITGRMEGRRNVGNKVVERTTVLGGAPRIELSRLRSTWLSWLLTFPVPLAVIMAASGIRSARTLTDLLGHIATAETAKISLTRDGEAG